MRKVAVGYSIPLLISFLTFIAEMSLNRCAWGKPRAAIQKYQIFRAFFRPFLVYFSSWQHSAHPFQFDPQAKGQP